ncbi:MAG: hypothetical protein JRG76_08790 [Deltaproteobacteria bacterium]|nr:hypothetical protein [Deltaproteobacteria bacterium]MBW2414590.1 hypothetical protein [Deltaproteobacteria bacterium]
MRIHGVHLQGLDTPRGVQKLACEPGYTLFLSSDGDAVRRLGDLVRSLVDAAPGLAEPGRWVSGEASDARADVSLSFGSDAYRVVADLGGRRLALASYGRDRAGLKRAATEPAEIRRRLEAAGLPDAEAFHLLCNWRDPATPAEAPDPTDPEPARRSELREARGRYLMLERRFKELGQALEERAEIAEHLDDLEARVTRYRDELVQRARSLDSIAMHREALRHDRERLRGAPTLRLAGVWAGLGLAAGGAGIGYAVGPAGWLASGVGLAVAGVAAFSVSSARAAFGRNEARLASLRADEREVERHFRDETQPLRQLIEALQLDSSEALLRVASEYRGLERLIESAQIELQQARAAFPEEAESELRDPSPAGVEFVARAAPAPATAAEPERLIDAAARAGKVTRDDLTARLAPVLPVYLRALTGGAFSQARYTPVEGWRFHRVDGTPPVSLDDMEPADRLRVRLAFRLALLEALAAHTRLPLLIGPETGFSSASDALALSRALRRLASVVQVLHFASGAAPWSAQADRVHQLG